VQEPLPRLLSKLLKSLFVLTLVSAIAAAGFIVYDYFNTRDRFPSPTYIGRINVSGLTEKAALVKLSRYPLSFLFTTGITFEAAPSRFSFLPEDIGLRINYPETVRRAFRSSHDGSYINELQERLKREVVINPLVLVVDDRLLRSVVEGIADEVRTSSRDASVILYEETGGFHIEAEDVGREVNIQDTIKQFKQKLYEGEKIFPLAIKYSYPRVKEKDLRSFPPVYRLAAFTTYYGRHDSPNRIHNIKLIASWLDGTLLMPDDEFSLANTIGDFTPERGFKEAFVIYQGVLVPQLGGGTCQIGTTLYNAISLADFEVKQRQNHSFYFNIYPLGRDATVYPGQKDLVFKNNTGHPVIIKAVATNRRLSFRVYGTPTGKKVEFSFPKVYLLTESGYQPASVAAVLEADAPFKTIITRTVFDSTGKKIKVETINSFYKLYGEKTNVPIARPEPR
jgi:vancomycin resistance protein YoaR